MTSRTVGAARAVDENVLRDLLDKQEIREAVYRSCRGVDRLDRELLRSAYHVDGYDNHGPGLSGPVSTFIDALLELCERYYTATTHLVCNQLIEVEGDSASCESYYVGVQTWRTDDGKDIQNVSYARYIDRFEWRSDAGWRIAHRTAVLDSADDAPRPFSDMNPDSAIRGARDRTDPVYSRP